MFIHLGENVVVPVNEIVTILDGQLYHSSMIVREFIEGQRKKNGANTEISRSMKTIIVTVNQIYFSPLASVTLKRRANQMFDPRQILQEL
ncbi:extracellular matrix regulator RemB [Bacillus sp. DJP31]|uniref:extracellular matrix regulator RemB n=1 Tax=Bacillus sp. DJP31 TaxID=3409789 RepID=UPI003BB7B5A1